MKANQDLARAAAERIDAGVDLPLQNLDATIETMAAIIADTYADAMKDRDELRKSLETARGQLNYWMYAAGAIYKPSGDEDRLWIDEHRAKNREFTVWRFRNGRTTWIATCDCIEHATEVLDGLKEVARRSDEIRQPTPQPPEAT